MCSFQKIFLLAFLAALFHPSSGQNDIIESIKDILVRNGHKLTNATRPNDVSSGTIGELVLGYDMPIVGQIISLLNCGPFPHLPNSHLRYSLDYVNKTLRLFQACDRYFKSNLNPEVLQVECRNKKWVFNEIGCEKTTCPRLTAPPGGHISTNVTTYNTTVYFWCGSGFSLKGNDKLFCEERGLWNLSPPTCNITYCRSLSPPPHGFVSSQSETAANQTVKFSCESEYSLLGDAVLRCQSDGRWNTTAPVCKKLCTVPDITSQSEGVRLVPEMKQLAIGSRLEQGQRVIFSCKPGYIVSSHGLSICIAGAWRPPILCRKPCTAVNIANGKYTLSKDSSTIEYSCRPGYQLVGQRKLSCTPNITWDNKAPICTKVCTLSEQKRVLSFRRKVTYEVIPVGTQITNGTQVYSICRPGSQKETTLSECIHGKLSPYPCRDTRSRIQSGLFEILNNGQWVRICYQSSDVCGAFGYSRNSYTSCSQCYDLNLNTYLSTLKIVVTQSRSSGSFRHTKNCVRCL